MSQYLCFNLKLLSNIVLWLVIFLNYSTMFFNGLLSLKAILGILFKDLFCFEIRLESFSIILFLWIHYRIFLNNFVLCHNFFQNILISLFYLKLFLKYFNSFPLLQIYYWNILIALICFEITLEYSSITSFVLKLLWGILQQLWFTPDFFFKYFSIFVFF